MKNRVTDFVTCRTVLWWMVFTGIAVNFMLRVQLNLVIVAVVKAPEKEVINFQCADAINNTNLWNNNTDVYEDNYTYDTKEDNESLFKWNEYEQGLAMGAYYWIHWLSEIPGGVLARRYGTKMVFGMGNLMAVFLGLLLPIAMNHHLYSLIAIRVLQGLVAGVAYPTVHEIIAKWIPPNERSKFVSAYSGAGIAIGLTYPLSGLIIDSLGWESVFYVNSCLGIIWYLLWIFLVYDTPISHPRITDDEKNYILDNLGTSVDQNCHNSRVPWRKIVTSSAVWLSILSNWSICWGFFTLMTAAPTYFKFIHGLSINETGILAGLPHILSMIYSWLYAALSDWLLKTKRLNLTNVRKFATFGCTAVPAFIMFGMSFSGCHPLLAMICNITAVIVMGSVSSGPLANLLDLSPNYASVLLGICGLIVDIAGFLSPIVVGLLINNNQTVAQWRWVFIITALNMIIGCIIYCVWGTADQQPWNNYHSVSDDDEKNAKEQYVEEILKSQILSTE